MPRRVPVALELQAAQYLAEARRVEASTKVMDAQMGALDRAVDKVDRDMAELAVTTEAAKRQVDDLGDKSRGTAADLALLDGRIRATKLSVRELGLEFARTGDKAAGTQLGRERSLLARLERLRKELADLGPSGGAFGGASLNLAGGSMRGPLIGALVMAAVAAAPPIGAMLGGALAGATGTAAMAAGILSAAKNERVQAAAKDFGKSISEQFFAGGGAFVEPVIHGLDILEQGFGDMHVPDALAKMAPTVTVIAEGFADFGRNVMPGVNKALDRMGPFAAVAAEGFADMGDAVGEFLDDVTASQGSVEGLATLFHALNETIMFTGNSVEFLSDRWHTMLDNTALITGWMEDLYPSWYPLHDVFAKANDDTERLTGTGESLHGMFRKIGPEAVDPFTAYLRHAWQQMEQLRGETEATRQGLLGYWNTLRGIADADIAWEQAVDDLTESVKENGRTLDITTEKGRNNVQAVYAGIDAAKRQYETGKITAAQYDQQIQKLIEIGVKAGLSRKELEKLAGTYTVTIVVNALVPAVQGAIALVSKAMQNVFSGGGGGAPYTGRGDFRAGGGPVVAGVPYTINERGYETVTFPASGTVHPASLTPQPWSGGAAGSQRNELTLRIIHETQDGRVTRRELITDALNRGVPQTTVSAVYP